MRKWLRRAPVASVEKSICPLRRESTSENSVRTENNWFRINRARAPVAQLDRASAFEVGSVNHISGASGVAYTQTRGATNPLNWTEVGPTGLGFQGIENTINVCRRPDG